LLSDEDLACDRTGQVDRGDDDVGCCHQFSVPKETLKFVVPETDETLTRSSQPVDDSEFELLTGNENPAMPSEVNVVDVPMLTKCEFTEPPPSETCNWTWAPPHVPAT
jgi:hypothetical protein